MRSMLADRGNLLVTRFDSSYSDSATIQTSIFDTALVHHRKEEDGLSF